MPSPTHWTLHGGPITVHYDSSGVGVLHYAGPPGPMTFNGPQIHVTHVPPVGTLVSVVLHVSPVAETVFSILIPDAQVTPAHPVIPVSTEGITTNRLLFPPVGQKEHYTVTGLTGTAW